MKRNENLIPLSREHHYGLLCVWKIREGVKKKILSSTELKIILIFSGKIISKTILKLRRKVFPCLKMMR